MTNSNSTNYDFVIVGAGPAGLTASIVAARGGLKVTVLEKGEQAGPKPRGEGMGYYSIVDEILGDNYLPSIGLKSNGGRVWHSPGDLQITTTYREYPHYFFEWRTFIDRFVEKANEAGVEILLNSEVIEPVEKNGRCVGVKYKDKSGNVSEIHGKAILDCSGYSGVIGRYYNVPYDEEINCPIVKCLISEANIDIKETPDLNFYFIGNGDLDYSPEFPQCVAYIFPLEEKRVEVGLMLRMAQVPQMKTVKIPTNKEILIVWEKLKTSYPGFSEFFKGAKIDYEEVTWLPNARMVESFVPFPGVVLIGDSAGFVNPFGSSGLYYSMEMAKFWVKSVASKLKDEFVWSSENIDNFKSSFEEFEVYKDVKGLYNLIGAFEYKIFNRLRTAEKINKKWDYISSLLKQAS
ncbi:MAG: NAD(P)/FAD-dependent oxidoreductase [Candidatus Lokiarchaeota archaeon]|nr:NAD(P)/FAD-dependent oxidoreductase [Candidatus Lokiarchaeota archaeon]